MHHRRETFEVGDDVRVVARLGLADLTIETTDDRQVTVSLEASGSRGRELVEGARIEQDGSTVSIEMPRLMLVFGLVPRIRATVTLPAGSAVEVVAGSGDLDARGPLSDVTMRTGSGHVHLSTGWEVELQSGSGDVTVGRAEVLRAKAGSGDIRVGHVAVRGKLTTGSGDITLDQATDVEVTSGSGRIEVGDVVGTTRLRSGSGGISVRRAGEGDLAARTGSGSIRIAVVPGVVAHLDVSTSSGSVRSSLEPTGPAEPGTPTLVLQARAASGSVQIDRAV